jgi:hypothetical protein
MMMNHIKFENGHVLWKQVERRQGQLYMRIVRRKQEFAKGLGFNDTRSEIFSITH